MRVDSRQFPLVLLQEDLFNILISRTQRHEFHEKHQESAQRDCLIGCLPISCLTQIQRVCPPRRGRNTRIRYSTYRRRRTRLRICQISFVHDCAADIHRRHEEDPHDLTLNSRLLVIPRVHGERKEGDERRLWVEYHFSGHEGLLTRAAQPPATAHPILCASQWIPSYLSAVYESQLRLAHGAEEAIVDLHTLAAAG